MSHVEAIHLIEKHGGAPAGVDTAVATGAGLDGDRHRSGTVTLIEGEALERLAREHGLDLGGGLSRRNLVTRGIDLGSLVGRRFLVGDVACEGDERCEPCAHLAGLTGSAVLRGLVHTGLRARIVGSGAIRVGDLIAPLD
jgi:MOSC domain-containing protein YiiM